MKEFTYILQKYKIKDKPDKNPEDLNTQFTEHSISQTQDDQLLKNLSTKSVVLAPFNTREAINQE